MLPKFVGLVHQQFWGSFVLFDDNSDLNYRLVVEIHIGVWGIFVDLDIFVGLGIFESPGIDLGNLCRVDKMVLMKSMIEEKMKFEIGHIFYCIVCLVCSFGRMFAGLRLRPGFETGFHKWNGFVGSVILGFGYFV